MTPAPGPLLQALDAVPWAELYDAYGPATAVSGFLRRLLSANVGRGGT